MKLVKPFLRRFLTLIIGLSTPLGTREAPARRSATVTIVVLDSRGHLQTGCKVLSFTPLESGANRVITSTDYKDKFEGLIGREIPFAFRYQTNIRCGEDGVRGTFLASVERPEQFIVLSAWANLGDYVTGPAPRLEVLVHRDATGQTQCRTWVKLVGIFLDASEIDVVNPQTQSAGFFTIVPGRYYLLVLDSESLACAKQIDFLQSHARLELALTQQGCKVDSASYVKILD